jgi:hypothetical protein
VPVRGRAVDVVEAHGDLGHDLEAGRASGREHGLVDPVAERRYERVHSAPDLLEDEVVGRRLDAVVDLDLPALIAQAGERGLSDVGGGEDAKRRCHATLSPQRARRDAPRTQSTEGERRGFRGWIGYALPLPPWLRALEPS